ncbi:MAG: hypothetical protein CMC55_06720 [Flavobacteriaceae bacterium]|uniref:DUF1761 domain-containing protein n=1 Tax=Bizionia echini TaxID=649333 RepID=UPI000C993161|nr:hypothetical protein [Flavobacteriaceae bacterium]|tara:strand:+ start:877 stop:1359 length:483 start_codon:yes stop_codon:yes gene_type:complete
MDINFIAILVAALVPLMVGFIWYNPKTFGNVWMRESGLTAESLKGGNMAIIFGLTFVFSFLIAFVLQFLTIHQTGALGMIGGDVTQALPSYTAFMEDYGMAFRTFKHGTLHGFMAGVLFVFPIMTINALFERKSWKYIFINSGYWLICTTLMGGIVCGWI